MGIGGRMEITDVKIFPVEEDKLRAYVTITLDGCFVVRDLKVISGAAGLFVAMPAKKRKDGTYKDIAHPLNAETRERFEKVVLAEYERVAKQLVPPRPGSSPEAYADPD
jgi:stage V sporulation protein G